MVIKLSLLPLIFNQMLTLPPTPTLPPLNFSESDQSLVCDRTLKFFQGIAHKCWVVAFSWMEKSLSLNRLLPEVSIMNYSLPAPPPKTKQKNMTSES